MFKNLVKNYKVHLHEHILVKKNLEFIYKAMLLDRIYPEIYLFLTKFELKLVFYKNTRISTIYELQPLYE